MAQHDVRVRFCGTFPHDRIGVILADIDVLVVPSIWYENTPLVLYFAQAAGCPVIATGLGGMAEVIRHEENGLLFEPGDAGGLAAALRRLAQDHGLLRKLAHNAVRPKSIAEYAAELLALYREVRLERGMQE
jgi:glycosyltransferase involved in cell wall biosynthesis